MKRKHALEELRRIAVVRIEDGNKVFVSLIDTAIG